MTTKETAICKIHKENDIVHLQFNESAILNHSDIYEVYEYVNEVYGCLPKLVDVRSNLVLDEKTRELLKELNTKYKIANQALLINENTRQEIIDIFIEMNNEKTPFNAFTDYERAINWLKSLDPLN